MKPLALLLLVLLFTPMEVATAGSPSGAPAAIRRLAFERNGEIWIAQIDGSHAEKIVKGVDPCIAPDGLTIAFTQLAAGR